MTVSDVKLKIFRQFDSFEKNRLEELYGVLLNFIKEKKDVGDWERLTDEQKQGIFEAIEEIESGKGIPNEKVMSEIPRKFYHALSKLFGLHYPKLTLYLSLNCFIFDT